MNDLYVGPWHASHTWTQCRQLFLQSRTALFAVDSDRRCTKKGTEEVADACIHTVDLAALVQSNLLP